MRFIFTYVFLFFTLLCFSQSYTPEELQGKIDPSTHPSFSRIPNGYSTRSQDYLRTEVIEAFLEMAKAAKKEGIDLIIVSATRNFDRQAVIWNKKWNQLEISKKKRAPFILKYSSMPGTSRHHWGTDFDLNSVEPSYFKTGKGKRIYEWLFYNAYKFGFFQPYQEYQSQTRTGYLEEKWHWSYYPIANEMLTQYNTLITEKDLDGFEGSRYAKDVEVIKKYVNGIVTYPFPLGQFPLPIREVPKVITEVKQSALEKEIKNTETIEVAKAITPKEKKEGPFKSKKIVVEYFSERPSIANQTTNTSFRNWLNQKGE